MSRPDVTLISPYPTGGRLHSGRSGVASYSANLARALAAEGTDVCVIADEQPGEPAEERDGRVRVERRFKRGPAALPAAAAAAADTGAPVVHLQHETFLYGGAGSIPGVVPALGRVRRGRQAVVATAHQVVDPATIDRDFARLHRVRAPRALARAGIAGVQAALRRLAGAVIVHEPAFTDVIPGARVVPHGVESASAPARERARGELGLDGRLAVLCFGFLAPYKGLEPALEAAARVSADVQLVVAGGEHPRLAGRDGYARELQERFGASARFTGRVPERDVARWFAAADLALFPYPKPFSSSGGLALALAYGTPFLLSPPLASCSGAPAELEAPLQPDALAARLLALAREPRQLERVRAASAAFGSGRSWRDVARRHLRIYEEVSDGHRASGRRLRAG